MILWMISRASTELPGIVFRVSAPAIIQKGSAPLIAYSPAPRERPVSLTASSSILEALDVSSGKHYFADLHISHPSKITVFFLQ